MNYEKISLLTGEDISKMTKTELYNIMKKYSPIAKGIRTRTFKELKEEKIKTTPSVYKKRYNATLRRYGYESYKDYEFKYDKDMTLNEMRFRVTQLRNFFRSGTRNAQDWEQVMKDFADRLKIKSGIKISKKNYGRLWTIYNRLVEQEKQQQLTKYDSGVFQRIIYDTLVGTKRIKKGSMSESEYLDVLTKAVTEKTDAKYVDLKSSERKGNNGGKGGNASKFEFGENL